MINRNISIFGLLGLALMLSAGSCGKDELFCGFGDEYMVFGHFYGECAGEGCVEIYRVDKNSLIEETSEQYPGDEFYSFEESVELSEEKRELVIDLLDVVPDELWGESATVIGVPDGGDWGGIYVEVLSHKGQRYWLLDQNETNMPAVYNDFVDRINEKIAIINQ